ncbi:MAG: DHA2 family efflux MFS transporter permease subunit, partial [Chromatiales bacterium]|nr:DHA2 family efflux MFS transporter permease subunit [Chromatiales bacterium]
MADTTEVLFERYGPNYRWYVTLFGLIGGFAMVLSATIANVAVPQVMGAYGVGLDQAQWMATAFLTTMTVSQLLNHWMGEAFGPRGAFTLTITVFLVGTAIGWFAPNMDMLIIGRVLQGFSAGIVTPMVMVIMFQVFPPEKRGLAMGVYGAGLVLAPALGPAVGGMAIDAFHWRYIFLMPVPFCLIALAGGLVFMPVKPTRAPWPPFDWAGYILLSVSLALLMTAAANGIRIGWNSDEIVLMLFGGTLGAILFVLWQLASRNPLLDFGLWRNPRFVAALVIGFVFGAGNFASSYSIPVFVQTVQGYTPSAAGLVLMPAGLLLVAVLPLTGRIADKLPHHVPIMLGLVCFAIGVGAMSTSDINTPFWTFAILICISRFGLAFIIPSLNVGALSTLHPSQVSRGSGNVNFIRQLGGAVGTNLIVVWLQLRTSFHAEGFVSTQTANNQTSQVFLTSVSEQLRASAIPEDMTGTVALHYLGEIVQAQALTFGFKDSFIALAVVFV